MARIDEAMDYRPVPTSMMPEDVRRTDAPDAVAGDGCRSRRVLEAAAGARQGAAWLSIIKEPVV